VLFNFIDFGLGVGMQGIIAEAYGRDEAEEIRRAFFSGAVALGMLALALLVVGLPIALFGHWADTLKVHTPNLRAQANSALAITLFSCALGIPLNAVARLAAGVQRGWLHAGWIAGGSAVTLAAVALAAWARLNFLAFLAAATLVPVIQGVGMLGHLAHVLHWPRHFPPMLPPTTLRRMLGESLLFSVPQVGLALVQTLPAVAIAMTAGPVTVTAYNLLQRLLGVISQGQIMLLTPIWPAYTEAQMRGDGAWIRRTFRFSMVATVGLGIVLALIAWQAPRLVHWWIGAATTPASPGLLWMTTLWTLLLLAEQPLVYLLVGMRRLRSLAVFGTAGYVASIVGMFAGGGWSGASGVLMGAVSGGTLIGLPGMAIAAQRALRQETAK